MAKFMIMGETATVYIDADNFEISGHWVLFTSETQSLLETDPLPKLAFVGAYKDVFGFYAVDDDGNQMDLLK